MRPALPRAYAEDIMQRFMDAFPEYKTDPVYVDVGNHLRKSLDDAVARHEAQQLTKGMSQKLCQKSIIMEGVTLIELLNNTFPTEFSPMRFPTTEGKVSFMVTLSGKNYAELVDAASDTYCMPHVFVQRLIRQELKRIRKEKENTDE